MKNLRRILVAVAILLVVACSVGIVAAAADQYTGTMTALQKEYQKVDKANDNVAKSERLEGVYAYLKKTPVDPESEGYAELIAKIDASAVTIASALIDDLNTKTSFTEKQAVYTRFASHVANCVPTVVTDEWNQIVEQKTACNANMVTAWAAYINDTADLNTAKASAVALYEHLGADSLPSYEYRELLNECSKAAYNVAQKLYEEIVAFDENVEYGQTKKLNKINLLQNYVAKVNISAGDTETPKMSARIKELVKWGEDMIAAKRAELDKQASFSSYDWTTYHKQKSFDEVSDEELEGYSKEERDAYKYSTTAWTSYNSNETNYSMVGKEANGNGYQALVYGSSASHLYIEPTFEDIVQEIGVVIEMDMWLSSNFYLFDFHSREPETGGGSKIVHLFRLDGTGNERTAPIAIGSYNNMSSEKYDENGVEIEHKKVTGIIERESWFHLTFTFDPETRTGKVYVNYEYLFDIAYNALWEFQGIRMSVNTTDMEVRMDNFEFYLGTQPRIYDKFLNMEDDQEFEYYVDYMIDAQNTYLSRDAAYKKAKNLLNTYKEEYLDKAQAGDAREHFQAYVDKFNNCNYVVEIKENAMKENIAILKGYVDSLKDLPIDSTNFEELEKMLGKIDKFVSENGTLINKGDTTPGGYQSQMAVVNSVKKSMAKIKNAMTFVDALEQFARATTSTAMIKRYEAVKAIYELAKYNDPKNADEIANDPYIVAFEDKINKDCKPGEEKTIFEYYDSIESVILVREIYENSKKVLECYSFITSLEGYESTTEFWRANYDFIASYASIIRDVVNPGLYNEDMDGMAEAVAEFRKLDVYFYERLQREYIANIKTQLEKHNAVSAYIDKAGICAGLMGYVSPDGENNLAIYLSVDENGDSVFTVNPYLTAEVAKVVADEMEELRQLEIAIYVYNEELTLREEDYDDVLKSNTANFLSAVKYMQTAVTYAEIKAIFEQATVYYYSINLENDEVVAAAEIYDQYRRMLNAWEENGLMFIGLVSELKAAENLAGLAREDALYATIAKCSSYVDGVDTTMEGVDVAMKAYTRILNEYVAETNATNAIIENTDTVVFACSAQSLAAAVLSVLVGIVKH